jgi:GNAT superfamily N-acetyltransferase
VADHIRVPARSEGTDDFDRVAVTVTYLEMTAPRATGSASDTHMNIVRVEHPHVSYYRYLYNTVGEPWLWWRCRVMSDADLQAHLDDAATQVYVHSLFGQPQGFFELDLRPHPDIELAYFGLLPFAIGRGLGREALNAALETTWALAPRAITVNTCTADHPRALQTYLQAGFKQVRARRDEWLIPRKLGLKIPPELLRAV